MRDMNHHHVRPVRSHKPKRATQKGIRKSLNKDSRIQEKSTWAQEPETGNQELGTGNW